MMKDITCAVLGTDTLNLSFGYNEMEDECILFKEKLKEKLTCLIEKENVTRFILSPCPGISLYASEIILGLKKKYPFLTLECVIPYENFSTKWTESFRDRFFEIMQLCDKETMTDKKYTSESIEKSGLYISSSSDVILKIEDDSFPLDKAVLKPFEENGNKIFTLSPIPEEAFAF